MTIAIKWIAKDVGVIRNFLSQQECADYIDLSESKGYADAPVTAAQGMVMMKDVRNNDRVMFEDFERSSALFERVRSFLPPRFKKKWNPVGVNERLRVYRYDVGQQFDWHRDGYFERPDGERSFFTFMIYLNESFRGGGTSFRDDQAFATQYDGVSITPETDMALLFHHPIVHRGDPVTEGRKYVLRTDVMYRRRPDERAA